MSNNLENSQSPETFQDFINKSIALIYDEQLWGNNILSNVTELTYHYDAHTHINTSLFCNIGELDIQQYNQTKSLDIQETLFDIAYKSTKNILIAKRTNIRGELMKIKDNFLYKLTEEEELLKNLFINSLNEKDKLLHYALLALPIEAQKAGFINQNLNSQEYGALNEQLNKLDKELFGGDIKDNPEETQLLYATYRHEYESNKEKLSQEEQKRMERYLGVTSLFLPDTYEHTPLKTANKIDDGFLQQKLSRDEYIPLFNEVLKGLKDSAHIAQVKNNVASVADTPSSIDFPNTPSFDSLTLERILQLMNHECEAHCISDHNSQALIGQLRGAGSTMKDEGVAILMEHILLYGEKIYTQKNGKTIIDKSKIAINPAYMQILMCEVLNNEELKDFLELSHKLIGGNISPQERYMRLKRNNDIYGQHKDILYLRGLFQAIDEINRYILTDGKKGLSMEDMFIGKVSFEETKILKQIKQKKLKQNPDCFQNINFLQPKFIAETIYYLLKNNLMTPDGKISKSFSQINFKNHLQKKYPIINISDDIFNHITYVTKKSVYKILKIISQNEKIKSEETVNNQ